MRVTDFGVTSKGEEAKLYILSNEKGMEIAVTDYGAALVSAIVPDKDGHPCDVVLGYDEAAGYEAVSYTHLRIFRSGSSFWIIFMVYRKRTKLQKFRC